MPTDIFKAARSPKTGVFGQALLRLAPVRGKGGLKLQRPTAAISDTFRAQLLGLA